MNLKVGDKVTFESAKNKQICTVIVDGEGFKDELLDENFAKILKIERPKYEVIEENKELLTEEEKAKKEIDKLLSCENCPTSYACEACDITYSDKKLIKQYIEELETKLEQARMEKILAGFKIFIEGVTGNKDNELNEDTINQILEKYEENKNNRLKGE